MNAMPLHTLAIVVSLLTAGAMTAAPALAAGPAQEAAHNHAAAAPSKLSLNQGRRWATRPAAARWHGPHPRPGRAAAGQGA